MITWIIWKISLCEVFGGEERVSVPSGIWEEFEMTMRLMRDVLEQPATQLAPELLGRLVCRKTEQGILKYRIMETECYFGEEDTACHASKGKTDRTKVLYEKGGTAYIYLCYGIHSLFNVVSGREGHPEAVLIRGVTG